MTNMIRKCTPAEARAAFLADNGCQIVDVREFSEYDAERVEGATLASLSALDQNLGLIELDRPVYLMCRSGNRAQQAAERLAGQGFKDLRVIEGGLQGWSEAGLPVERGKGRVWSFERRCGSSLASSC